MQYTHIYSVLSTNPDSYPPDISDYLASSTLKSKIGAESNWQMTNNAVYSNFAATGDWMRNSRLDLEKVINAGVGLVYLSTLQTFFNVGVTGPNHHLRGRCGFYP